MWELWEVEISAFPLTWHIAYTTACCYRTSRDTDGKIFLSCFSDSETVITQDVYPTACVSFHNVRTMPYVNRAADKAPEADGRLVTVTMPTMMTQQANYQTPPAIVPLGRSLRQPSLFHYHPSDRPTDVITADVTSGCCAKRAAQTSYLTSSGDKRN